MQLFILSILFAGSQAFFEGYEKTGSEVDSDPHVKQTVVFYQHATTCMSAAFVNKTSAGLEEPLGVCCLRDYWSRCMKAIPMLYECMSNVDERMSHYEESIATKKDCLDIDLKKCPHNGGNADFEAYRARQARYLHGSSSVCSQASLGLLLLTFSLSLRHVV